MLVIRDEQLQALQDSLDARFAEQLATIVGQRFPDRVRGTTALSNDVLTYVRQAKSYGITHPAALADYVGLKFDLGIAFNRHPAVAAILEDPSVASGAKIAVLMMSLTDSDWDDVRRFCLEQEPR